MNRRIYIIIIKLNCILFSHGCFFFFLSLCYYYLDCRCCYSLYFMHNFITFQYFILYFCNSLVFFFCDLIRALCSFHSWCVWNSIFYSLLSFLFILSQFFFFFCTYDAHQLNWFLGFFFFFFIFKWKTPIESK